MRLCNWWPGWQLLCLLQRLDHKRLLLRRKLRLLREILSLWRELLRLLQLRLLLLLTAVDLNLILQQIVRSLSLKS